MPSHVKMRNGPTVLIVLALAAAGLLSPSFGGGNSLAQTDSTAAITVPLGAKPTTIASGDFNLDTRPDLAVVSETNQVSIFLNNGGVSFFHFVSYSGGNSTLVEVKVADFNLDSKPDIVTTARAQMMLQPELIQVRLGDGTGNFAAPINKSAGRGPITIGDFNGDGKPDVGQAFTFVGGGPICQGSRAQMFLGSGTGTLSEMPYVPVRANANAIERGDFNNDGKLDLAVASGGDPTCAPPNGPLVSILLGDGLGNFPIKNELSAYWGRNVVSGDFNLDSKLDLALTPITGVVEVILGTGAGDFVGGPSTTVSGSRFSPQAADFNNDGKLDIALVNSDTNSASIIFGDGTGSFPTSRSFATGFSPYFLTVNDFNNDTHLDIAVTNYNSNSVTVIVDTTTPTSPLRTQFDFEGDLKADIAVYRDGNTPGAPSYWYILYSSGAGYQGIPLGANGDKPVPADYNGDGRTEVAVWRPSTGTWYTSPNPATNYGAFHWGQNGDVPLPGDFDGDGRADYAVYRPSNGVWYVRRSSDGGFQFQQFGIASDKPVLGDFDVDGKTDYAFYRPGATSLANSFWNFLQSSNGGFFSVQFGRGQDKPVPADYNGDGMTDFAVFRPSTSTWYTSLNPATNFGEFRWGSEGDVPTPADYDRDGKADLAVFRPGNTVWYILRSTDQGLTGVRWGLAGDRPVPSSFLP